MQSSQSGSRIVRFILQQKNSTDILTVEFWSKCISCKLTPKTCKFLSEIQVYRLKIVMREGRELLQMIGMLVRKFELLVNMRLI